ncbi:hypothetical protein [Glycomyces harbinensis]|uniref:Uncharacterized protein n=1 Tax=Glycomyces harbinensis TaxID=58114 RepID=A0A1G7DK75_9ACTN|nr:hypothetical protein [Glycomyces harbinensis]SDE51892.1 hypothetical protein SAMN05216270_1263 [Glycomyces harbinensis]
MVSPSNASSGNTGSACDFCGRSEGDFQPVRVSQFRPPSNWYCESCKALYDGLEARWAYERLPGNRPWLLLDPGTERTVGLSQDPYPSVEAAVNDIHSGLIDVEPVTARIAAVKLSVFAEPDPLPHTSRQVALASVSRVIADALFRDYEYHREDRERRRRWGRKARSLVGSWDDSVRTVALFGAGSGIMYQRAGDDGRWLSEESFLIDTRHAVHRYTYWSR